MALFIEIFFILEYSWLQWTRRSISATDLRLRDLHFLTIFRPTSLAPRGFSPTLLAHIRGTFVDLAPHQVVH